MVEARLASPWWYALCSDTYPDSCATAVQGAQTKHTQENNIVGDFDGRNTFWWSKYYSGSKFQVLQGVTGCYRPHLDVVLELALEAREQHLAAGAQAQVESNLSRELIIFGFQRLKVPESKRGVNCCQPGVNLQRPTLRWEGLKPSTMEGMDRIRSARLNRISSLLMKSVYSTSNKGQRVNNALATSCDAILLKKRGSETWWMMWQEIVYSAHARYVI